MPNSEWEYDKGNYQLNPTLAQVEITRGKHI